ncbi:MAG: helix-turn-helix transcriptional regulator [Clostridia bacterium]|nr:helix-turn-helix transcriptional regulator [Clostridia bacterium]
MEKSGFSLRLIALRKARNMTQEDVAKALGLNRSTYTCYEIGTSSPSIATLRALAEMYDVSVDYLLARVDIPVTENMDERLSEAEEMEVLELYRGLTKHRREMVISIMKEF